MLGTLVRGAGWAARSAMCTIITGMPAASAKSAEGARAPMASPSAAHVAAARLRVPTGRAEGACSTREGRPLPPHTHTLRWKEVYSSSHGGWSQGVVALVGDTRCGAVPTSVLRGSRSPMRQWRRRPKPPAKAASRGSSVAIFASKYSAAPNLGHISARLGPPRHPCEEVVLCGAVQRALAVDDDALSAEEVQCLEGS